MRQKTLIEALQNKNKKKVFGLVLQGGGMRAAYSAGALVPLIEAGLEGSFNHVIGSSAGAINGAYFLTGYSAIPDTYTKELTNKKFINYTRKSKIVDIDFLVDEILYKKHPIDIQKLKATKTKLHIVLTNAKNGKKEIVSDPQKLQYIYEEFRATAALPILYDKKIAIGEQTYIDGGVSDLIPVDVAYKLGCTDIVVITTRKLDYYKFDKRHSRLVKHLIKHFAKTQSQAVKNKLPTNEKLLKLNIKRIRRPIKGINIYLLEPSNDEYLVSLGTIDKKQITELAQMGVEDMRTFLAKM